MAALHGRDAGDAFAGCGPSDQSTISPGPATLRGVDDDIDQPIVDETHRVPRSFSDFVNVVGGHAGGRQCCCRPGGREDAKTQVGEDASCGYSAFLVSIGQ
jgi:hypothetical protein